MNPLTARIRHTANTAPMSPLTRAQLHRVAASIDAQQVPAPDLMEREP